MRSSGAGGTADLQVLADMLAQEREKLFGATALISLEVPDYDQFASRLAAGQAQVNERAAVVGQAGQLRQ